MHTIRLRHPWAFDVLPDGRTSYARKFHRPTGLTSERVTLNLHCNAPWTCTAIRLNNNLLEDSAGDSLRLDVTSQLQPFNTLECEFASASPTNALETPAFDQLASAHLEIIDS